jgi:DNA-binding NtrC family response regulator
MRALPHLSPAALVPPGRSPAPAYGTAGLGEATAQLAELLIGESAALAAIRTLVARAAPTTLPVLIEGETGVGKERVAMAVHAASSRPGAFVAVNVSAIPEGVFESELFGHVAGAFTGATAHRTGFCAEADQGTLFLDEIGTLSGAMQSKLLRVLETGRFYPVGASRERVSRFRVVSATNVALDERVATGQFRDDLWHRLAGMIVRVPPLRARPEDVPALVQHFLAPSRGPVDGGIRVSASALALLAEQPWPGNARELRNVLARAMVLAPGPVLSAAVVADALGDAATSGARLTGETGGALVRAERDVVYRLLVALDEAAGDTAVAARLLGVSRTTVYRWLRAAGLRTPQRRRRGKEAGMGAA